MLGTLATLALVLPNYTVTTLGPVYSPVQLVFIGAVSLVLYLTFVFVQTIRHRDYFLDGTDEDVDSVAGPRSRPPARIAAISVGLLILSLATVILLSKVLSYPLDQAVSAAGLPQSFVGVVIAAVVLLPEGIASVRAALANHLQNSMNLALGSALASIGLTIPVVAVVSLLFGLRLTLGLDAEGTVLLVLTLFVSTLTLGTGRTTVLQGRSLVSSRFLVSAIPEDLVAVHHSCVARRVSRRTALSKRVRMSTIATSRTSIPRNSICIDDCEAPWSTTLPSSARTRALRRMPTSSDTSMTLIQARSPRWSGTFARNDCPFKRGLLRDRAVPSELSRHLVATDRPSCA